MNRPLTEATTRKSIAISHSAMLTNQVGSGIRTHGFLCENISVHRREVSFPYGTLWWKQWESNLLSPKATDLQSAPALQLRRVSFVNKQMLQTKRNFWLFYDEGTLFYGTLNSIDEILWKLPKTLFVQFKKLRLPFWSISTYRNT